MEEGARYLVLNSRRGAYTAEQGRVLDDLAQAARVEILEADVADTPAFQAALHRALSALAQPSATPMSLRGIIHAAGVSGGSAPLAATNSAALTEVLRAKVAGAWAMHQLSLGRPTCETFICFLPLLQFGVQGQGPYTSSQCLSRRACSAFAIVWVFPP